MELNYFRIDLNINQLWIFKKLSEGYAKEYNRMADAQRSIISKDLK